MELAAQAEPAAKTPFNDFFNLCLAEASKAAALAVVAENVAAAADVLAAEPSVQVVFSAAKEISTLFLC